jgi:hypothetical protein
VPGPAFPHQGAHPRSRRALLAAESADIAYESGTTVTADYTAGTSRFTGRIN